MSNRNADAAYTELTPDTWHQADDGNFYVDCPECGSAATLTNVVAHGRCNGYLDQDESETELDEEAVDCTARLWFELAYESDPDGTAAEDAVGEDSSELEAEDGVPAEEQPPGVDGTVNDE